VCRCRSRWPFRMKETTQKPGTQGVSPESRSDVIPSL
jgi:hypothetical protein